MNRLFIVFIFLLAAVQPLNAWETGKQPLKPEYYQYSESDFWANLWLGYSFCALDDVRASSAAWDSHFSGIGTSSTHPNVDAINLGLEGGWLMDGLNGFSISVEDIEVSQSSYQFSAPPLNLSMVLQPNVYSFSLNFYHFIDQKKDAQTYICAGAGYYLGSESFAENFYNNGVLAAWSKGKWEGGTVGGTLGAGARINAGKNFGIQLDARGRYATISGVTTNYKDDQTKTTYLSVLTVDQDGLIGQEPVDQPGSVGPRNRNLVFDFSGFDLNIGVFYHF